MRYIIIATLLLCSACTLTSSQQPVETIEITDVPTPGEQVQPTIAPSTTTAPPPTAQQTEEVTIDGCPVPTGWVIYEIKAGETLGALARARNLTVDEITEANCLDNPNTIFEGQQIVLPPESSTTDSQTNESGFVYDQTPGCEIGMFGDEARAHWEGGPCVGVSPALSVNNSVITVAPNTTISVRWINPPENATEAVFELIGALDTDPDLVTNVDTDPSNGLSGMMQIPAGSGGGRIAGQALLSDGTRTTTAAVPIGWGTP